MSNNKLKSNQKLLLTLLFYFVLFYASWAFVELVVKGWLEGMTDGITLSLLRDGLIKNLIWTLPALLLIRCFSGQLAVDHREMWRFKKSDWKVFLPLLLLLVVFVVGGSLMRSHTLTISPGFGWEDVIVVLFVGLTEELVFRGWLLNATAPLADTEVKKWLWLLLNALLFLTIHFPIWISSGLFVSNFKNLGFVTIMALSAVFGLSFLKTKNLLVPILLHSVYDLLIFMLY